MATAVTTAARAKFAPIFLNTVTAKPADIGWLFGDALPTAIENSLTRLLFNDSSGTVRRSASHERFRNWPDEVTRI